MSDDLTTAYLLGVEHMRDKLHKQADEIERLKREAEIRIDQIEREQEAHLKTMAELNKAADEIERLSDTRIEFIDIINKLVDERVSLRKDIQRLREALTEAVGHLEAAYLTDFTERYKDAANAAKAALGKTDD